MGIRNLNKFLRSNCQTSIQCVAMSELAGKKIAVDISIYMYKFAGDGTLIENMYLMLSIFRYYKIIPVFIFDGKSPTEKKELLEKRRRDKQSAQKEYNALKKQLETDTALDNEEKMELNEMMDVLKKKFVYIKKEDVDKVKRLIRAFGATYIDAPGEADELCASLAITKKVWACMSEDMDLFVYGCPRVLRYFSLLKHNVVVYTTKQIFEELGISEEEFRQICILSGTDYNLQTNQTTDLYTTLKLFKKYKKNKQNESTKRGCINSNSIQTNNINFYDWLMEKTDYIKNQQLIESITDLFNLQKNNESMDVFKEIKIVNGQYIKNDIMGLLMEDGFIFPEK